uniref:Uncharacterized protein n=1 Tax=Rhizophora mucronata TaxID=61149 RepID=A0A2P2Q6T4_RHIMU
MAVQAPGKTCN